MVLSFGGLLFRLNLRDQIINHYALAVLVTIRGVEDPLCVFEGELVLLVSTLLAVIGIRVGVALLCGCCVLLLVLVLVVKLILILRELIWGSYGVTSEDLLGLQLVALVGHVPGHIFHIF